jgi:DnaK suppressor protein
MSDLTPQQLEKLKHVLNERYRTLLAEVRNELSKAGNSTYEDMAGQVGDAGDESVADLITDLGATLVDRQVQAMREIELARQRMREGSYGVCIDCGLEIPLERLLAYPTALRDVQCQTQYEKNYFQEGRPTL